MNHMFWNAGAILETLEKKRLFSVVTVPILATSSHLEVCPYSSSL